MIDLNADLGESFGAWTLGDDRAILACLSSANVACGFHAGDPATIRTTCRAAVEAGVVIGAHIGYRDLVGFGRRHLQMAPQDVRDEAVYQIGALQGIARSVGGAVRYVKPHGALYHDAAGDPATAAAVIEAIRAVDPSLSVMCLPGSSLLALAADAGLATVAEAFADRRYRPDGGLVDRTEAGSVLTATDEVVAQALSIAARGTVTASDGSTIPLVAASLCLHGDTPDALAHAIAVREALQRAGIEVAPFA